MRRGERGDLGVVERRRDLDEVHADEVEPAEPAHQLQRLPAREPARHRRAGARREGRVEPVDVEGEIDRRVARPRRGSPRAPRRCRCGAPRARSGSRAPRRTSWKVRMPTWVERAGSTSPSRIARPIIVPWSMPPGIVGPEVAVGVELDQRQRPVLRGMRPQQRPGDEMVAAERQQLRARGDHLGRRRLDRRAPRVAGWCGSSKASPRSTTASASQQVEAPGKGLELGELHRGGADRPRPEPAAGAVGHRGVVGKAHHRDVDAGEVAGVAAAQEARARRRRSSRPSARAGRRRGSA